PGSLAPPLRVVLVLVPDRGLQHAPEDEEDKAHRDGPQGHLAEGLGGQLGEGPLAGGLPVGPAERELQGDPGNEQMDHPVRDESRACEVVHPFTAVCQFTVGQGCADDVIHTRRLPAQTSDEPPASAAVAAGRRSPSVSSHFSRIATTPWPPAAQMEIRPRPEPFWSSNLARTGTMRPPVAANGCAAASEEP